MRMLFIILASALAIACLSCNTADSPSTSGKAPAANQVATPVISPNEIGTWHSNLILATITCATAGADIYFTNDGTVPSQTNGALVTSTSQNMALADTRHQIWAIAIKSGMTDSEVAKVDYTFAPNVGAALRFENKKAAAITYTGLSLRVAGTSAWGPNELHQGVNQLFPDGFIQFSQIDVGSYDAQLTTDSGGVSIKANIPIVKNGTTTVTLP
jgi:hypothetical protein